jgi:hypothetical protein
MQSTMLWGHMFTGSEMIRSLDQVKRDKGLVFMVSLPYINRAPCKSLV